MATATPYVFSPLEHSHLVPYLAALHASCITYDGMMGAFLPPLNHEKLLAWWKDRLAEVSMGSRVIILLLLESQPGTKAKGPELMGVVMLNIPVADENAQIRADIEKLLISPKYREKGGARMLTQAVEVEAVQRGKTTLVGDGAVSSRACFRGMFFGQAICFKSERASCAAFARPVPC